MRRIGLSLILVLLASCDGAPSAPGPVRLPSKTVVEIKPISQLPPNRIAHVAVDTLGNIFYALETEKGTDGTLVVTETGIPRGTQLTSANILAAMGETVGGSGAIQSLVAGPEGIVWFYFVGGKGRALRACVGQFLLRNESINIVFDARELSYLSGMGESLALARGTLLPAGNRMRLLLRHTDVWAIFQFENRSARGRTLELTRPFLCVWAEDQELDLTRTRFALSSGVGESMLLFDNTTGELWQVDAIGRATLRTMLTGAPRELSRPVVVKDDKLLIFAADSAPIEADVATPMRAHLPQTTYPALLEIGPREISAIGRDDLRVFGGLSSYAIRIHQLVADPDGSYVAYDLGSGQLLRLRKVSVD